MAPVHRIHPAIGIARVGDAARSDTDGWFIGPEVPGIPANFDCRSGHYRPFKANGLIKAQAARFRIFEYDRRDGALVPVREVNLDSADVASITWRIELANKKASFFKFSGSRGEADLFTSRSSQQELRNFLTIGSETRRDRLEITPGEKAISGRNHPEVEFQNTKPNIPIPSLGQLRTDSAGRLLVLGGSGKSGFDPTLASSQPDGAITDYANNDQWFDSVSDGPVRVEIRFHGQEIPVQAEPAWVIVAPPDFAPPIRHYRSLYDTLVDLIVREFPALPSDEGLYSEYAPGKGLSHIRQIKTAWNPATRRLEGFRPSFTRDIFPVLNAAFHIQAVHHPDAPAALGPAAFHDAMADVEMADLGGPGNSSSGRRRIFNRLRDPAATSTTIRQMPRSFGDEYRVPGNPQRFHALSAVQYELMRLWRDGEFDADWLDRPALPSSEDITPEGLDRAALDAAVGGSFYPGIEASWLIRNPRVYTAPFRVALGKTIAQDLAIGDLVINAGFFTQQMALPWQADFLACSKERAGAEESEDAELVVAWWPTQRPDDVHLAADLAPVAWDRGLTAYVDMVERWSTRGFVVDDTAAGFLEIEGPPPEA